MKPFILASAVAAAVAAPAAALAQAPSDKPPAKPSTPTLEEVLETSGITVQGYVDASYSYLSGNGLFTSGVANRVFDTDHSSFYLNQAAITIAKQPKEGFGGLVNLIVGSDANVIAPFPTNPGAKSNFDVTQAFVQYATGPLTVIAGKYVTAAGAEVINPTADVNVSRSILFGYAIPFTHTGARATYTLGDVVTLIGGVNNGWDDLKDTNTQKTVELGASLTPLKSLTISLVDYVGTERAGGLTSTGPQGTRNIFDLNAIWAATDKLTLTLNYDYGTQDNTATVTPNGATKAKWTGLAGYVTYQFTDQWRLSVRAEYFNDEDGYRTGVVQKWKEGTLTLAFLPAKSFELRGEFRYDSSNKSSFVQTNGSTDKNQYSLGLEAIYKF